MNINYLVLRILHTKYMVEPGYQQVFSLFKGFFPLGTMQRNLCSIENKYYSDSAERSIFSYNNLCIQYERSGFIWESYYSETGQGKGVHPFTGWTTLVVLIMAEMYYIFVLFTN